MSKLTKKELRSPDQVWQASAQSFKWLRSNWIIVSILVGLGFVLLVATLYLQQVNLRTESEAQAVYGEVSALFEQWQIADSETQPSIEANLTASLAKLAEEFPESDANHLASLYRARLKLVKAENEQAITDLSHYLQALPKGQSALALYPKAMAHEELGQWPEALQAYEKILKDSEDINFRKWAMLGKARAQEKMNLIADASGTYDEFLNEFASAPEASLARGLKARLGN